MKKIYLLVLMIIAFTLALTACGGPNTNHDNHNFGDWVESGDEANSCDEKLYSRTCTDCGEIEWKQGNYEDHIFNTVTTPPTCTEVGFDTKTCTLCGKTEVCNETQKADHTYSKENDNTSHWDKCDVCDTTANASEHTPGSDSICTACGFLVGPTEGVMYDLSDDGTYAIVIGYTGTATYVKIADTYNDVPVKEIYDNAFLNQNIAAIIMPESLTTIGDYAFSECQELTSVVIPETVTHIGSSAFIYCSNLSSITIPSSVTYIGSHAFSGCNSALYTEYENAKYIGDKENPYIILEELTNKNLTTYKIHSQTRFITDMVFSECTRLTNIIIPDQVTYIGDLTFNNCTNLASVTINGPLISIGSSAFSGCSSLTSVIMPDTVTSINAYAFHGCKALTSLTFVNPNGWYFIHSSGESEIPSSDLSDPATAANKMINKYYWYDLVRK